MPKFLIKFRDTLVHQEQEIEADGFEETADGKHYRFWNGTKGTAGVNVAMIPAEVVRIVETVEG